MHMSRSCTVSCAQIVETHDLCLRARALTILPPTHRLQWERTVRRRSTPPPELRATCSPTPRTLPERTERREFQAPVYTGREDILFLHVWWLPIHSFGFHCSVVFSARYCVIRASVGDLVLCLKKTKQNRTATASRIWSGIFTWKQRCILTPEQRQFVPESDLVGTTTESRTEKTVEGDFASFFPNLRQVDLFLKNHEEPHFTAGLTRQ